MLCRQGGLGLAGSVLAPTPRNQSETLRPLPRGQMHHRGIQLLPCSEEWPPGTLNKVLSSAVRGLKPRRHRADAGEVMPLGLERGTFQGEVGACPCSIIMAASFGSQGPATESEHTHVQAHTHANTHTHTEARPLDLRCEGSPFT